MPVYHFTLHAYRSWRADNRRGYVHHTDGLCKPDKEIADARDRLAKFDEVTFDETIQRLLIRATLETCRRRNWRLHGAGNDETHLHLAISWKRFEPVDDVMNRLKNALSFVLGKEIGPRGRKWFVRGGSRKRVNDSEHLDYLLDRYFPDHPGVFWREGFAVP
ncbi:MAG TPA: hypothetical protein VLI90_14770 [Tepidisphaeraceae bacterium]|nr:hypothetical protein [Tepidisphaeraceae bacterium]